jgi:hypothetical protein
MTRLSVLAVLGAVLVMGASTVASASFFDLYAELPAPQYQEKKEEVVLFTNGGLARDMKFLNVTGQEAAPTDGVDNDCDSFFDIWVEVSVDGGGSWAPMTGSGVARWRFHGGTSVGGVQQIGAEVMSMSASIHGISDPLTIQVRESPTKASSGGGSCSALGGGGGGGGYMIDSFFDIFTEVSTDGGNTWAPSIQTSADGGQTWSLSAQSARIDGLPEPATLSLLALGGLALIRRRKK